MARGKPELRDQLLAARSRLSDSQRTAAGTAIAEHGLRAFASLATVAAYVSVGSEPPTLPLVEQLVGAGVTVLLPVVDGDDLDWAPYGGADALTAGPLGIVEPTTSKLGHRAIDTAVTILVPALAVDRHGNRLGRGRGYYDRALAGVTGTVIAVVYDEELVEEVPIEAHDRPVHAALRPSGITDLR